MPNNQHGSMLVIGDRGVAVTGASGSGKTSLCLTLIDLCRAAGISAHLVSDDQLLLEAQGGRLVARAPDAIAGLVEVRGYRPSAVAVETAAVVDLVVELVSGNAPRYNEDGMTALVGVVLPLLRQPARNTRQSATAVRARLQLPPFEVVIGEKTSR